MKKKIINKKKNKTYSLDFSGITPEMQIKKPEFSEIYEKTFLKPNDRSSHSQNTASME